jgi:hypothetical protein
MENIYRLKDIDIVWYCVYDIKIYITMDDEYVHNYKYVIYLYSVSSLNVLWTHIFLQTAHVRVTLGIHVIEKVSLNLGFLAYHIGGISLNVEDQARQIYTNQLH